MRCRPVPASSRHDAYRPHSSLGALTAAGSPGTKSLGLFVSPSSIVIAWQQGRWRPRASRSQCSPRPRCRLRHLDSPAPRMTGDRESPVILGAGLSRCRSRQRGRGEHCDRDARGRHRPCCQAVTMELGETNNPKDLVPGDPAAVSAPSDECGRYASCLELAGTGLQRIRTDGWTGNAADAFWERYHGEPKNWLVAADSFRTAATSIADYASALVWAQSNAGDAIDTWNAGNLATAKARLDYTAQQRLHPHIAFDDPGELSRAEARAILAEARRQLTQARDDAAKALAAASPA